MRSFKTLAFVAVLSLTSIASAASGDVVATGATASGTALTATASSGALSGFSELNVKGAPKLVKKDATSVTLEWNKVDVADSYIVKYSKKSVATSTDPSAVYEFETAPVTATGTTIDKLTENTTYFFAVVALDKEKNESEQLSDELSVNLSTQASFAVKSVKPVDTMTVSVEFSADLGDAPISVKLQKVNNSAAVAVATVSVDPTAKNKAIVKLSAALEPKALYSLTVISAKDASGNTIPEGINAMQDFPVPADITVASEVALNAAGSGVTESGATLSGSTGSIDTTKAVDVKTGAGQNLLILAALLLSLGIVFVVRKRQA